MSALRAFAMPAAALLALSLGDLATTAVGLHLGAVELNPLGVIGLTFGKVVGVGGLIGCALWVRDPLCRKVLAVAYALALAYSAGLVLSNAYVLWTLI